MEGQKKWKRKWNQTKKKMEAGRVVCCGHEKKMGQKKKTRCVCAF